MTSAAEQMPLFDGAPYQPHSDTSHEAAVYMQPRAGSLRRRVYDYLGRYGPATDRQLQEALDMPASTERPRRVELVRGGLVRDTGARARTHSGRRAVLWAANGGPG